MKRWAYITLLLAPLYSPASAQDQIFRCGGEYTATRDFALRNGCKSVGPNSPAVSTPTTNKGRRQGSRPSFEIEVSHDDEFFIINGEKFTARLYCFDMEEGDPVIFLDGSPLGVCVSATLLNLRSREKCEVWCE